MYRRPPTLPRTDTLFPYPALFRSRVGRAVELQEHQLVAGVAHHRARHVQRVRGAEAPVPAQQLAVDPGQALGPAVEPEEVRSEEHTSEFQSLMRISYAVFCLKHKKTDSTSKKKSYQTT